MDCLRCHTNEVSPGKALCANCLVGKPVLSKETQSVQSAIARHKKVQDAVSELDYAGFWLRVVAAIIDASILAFVQKILWSAIFAVWGKEIITYLLLGGSGTFDPADMVSRSLRGTLWFYLLPVVIYYGIFESSRWQSTPGKALLGIKVADLDGERLSPLKGVLRALARLSNLVSVFPTVIVLVSSPYLTWSTVILSMGSSMIFIPYSYAMAGFTAQKQALHDKVASTLVIKGPTFSKIRATLVIIIVMWAMVFYLIYAYQNPTTRAVIDYINSVVLDYITS